ncbi:hypothetical protein JCM19238_1002 [Vibrio ponticus]|nr:hypothetical protein JCM19238_1002 [Vibrio ponticus]
MSDSGIKVPLRLEYWNGSRFITNSDDSSTEVKGSNLVASNNVLWSDVELLQCLQKYRCQAEEALKKALSFNYRKTRQT